MTDDELLAEVERRGLMERVGWRNDLGRMCFGHEYHHRLDGIKWCEPVYRLNRRDHERHD